MLQSFFMVDCTVGILFEPSNQTFQRADRKAWNWESNDFVCIDTGREQVIQLTIEGNEDFCTSIATRKICSFLVV